MHPYQIYYGNSVAIQKLRRNVKKYYLTTIYSMVTLYIVTGCFLFCFYLNYLTQHLNLILEKCFLQVYFAGWDRGQHGNRDRTVTVYSAFVKQQAAWCD